jgi:UDP-sulfoquinovose synthase
MTVEQVHRNEFGSGQVKIAILGGDGFVGWPTSLHLSDKGHEVHIIDNLSRRWIDAELGVQSLTPMDSIQERTRIWKQETGRKIHFHLIDIAENYEVFKAWLAESARMRSSISPNSAPRPIR